MMIYATIAAAISHATLALTPHLASRPPAFSLNLWRDAQTMLQYDFMRRAFLAAIFLSVICGLVGYLVVLRHQVFAAEALSDVAFTGALGGAAFGLNPLASLFATTIVAALAMGAFGERLRGRDVAIGTVLAWILGLGVLFLNLFNSHVSGAGFSGVTVLFGALLGVTALQVRVIALVSVGVILALAFGVRPLLFATLDPAVALARGVPIRALGLAMMALLAVTVSVATLAVGALLVFALLLLPAAAAQLLALRPARALALAALLATLCAVLGLSIGFFSGYPTSVCISLVALTCYALALLRHRLAALVRPQHASNGIPVTLTAQHSVQTVLSSPDERF